MAFDLKTVQVTNVDTNDGIIEVQVGPETRTFQLGQIAALIDNSGDRSEGFKYLIALRLSADSVSLANGAAITNSIQRDTFEL